MLSTDLALLVSVLFESAFAVKLSLAVERTLNSKYNFWKLVGNLAWIGLAYGGTTDSKTRFCVVRRSLRFYLFVAIEK